MESLMTAQLDERQWYLAVGEQSLGPLSTELVVRGLRSGKVPPSAWICQVGATDWTALSSVAEFQVPMPGSHTGDANSSAVSVSAVSRGMHEPLVEESSHIEARGQYALRHGGKAEPHEVQLAGVDNGSSGAAVANRAVLPYECADSAAPSGCGAQEATSGLRAAVAAGHSQVASAGGQVGQGWQVVSAGAELTVPAQKSRRQPSIYDIGVEVSSEDADDSKVDWNRRFLSYFLVGTEVALPPEDRLLASLEQTPRHSILHDEALWNLSLCLAFGSERVAVACASAIHEALAAEREPSRAVERLEWLCRTLLSKGFMPSGIPRNEGKRGVEILRDMSAGPHAQQIIDRTSRS